MTIFDLVNLGQFYHINLMITILAIMLNTAFDFITIILLFELLTSPLRIQRFTQQPLKNKYSSRKNVLINEATSATSKFFRLPKLLQADVGPCKRRCSLCTKEQIGDSFPLRKPPWTSGNEKLIYSDWKS